MIGSGTHGETSRPFQRPVSKFGAVSTEQFQLQPRDMRRCAIRKPRLSFMHASTAQTAPESNTIVVGLSGGVDSSVSAALLVEAGYNLTVNQPLFNFTYRF